MNMKWRVGHGRPRSNAFRGAKKIYIFYMFINMPKLVISIIINYKQMIRGPHCFYKINEMNCGCKNAYVNAFYDSNLKKKFSFKFYCVSIGDNCQLLLFVVLEV